MSARERLQNVFKRWLCMSNVYISLLFPYAENETSGTKLPHQFVFSCPSFFFYKYWSSRSNLQGFPSYHGEKVEEVFFTLVSGLLLCFEAHRFVDSKLTRQVSLQLCRCTACSELRWVTCRSEQTSFPTFVETLFSLFARFQAAVWPPRTVIVFCVRNFMWAYCLSPEHRSIRQVTRSLLSLSAVCRSCSLRRILCV